MSSRLRCPKCGEGLADARPGQLLVCPGCGVKLKPKEPARAAPAEDFERPQSDIERSRKNSERPQNDIERPRKNSERPHKKSKRLKRRAKPQLPVPVWVLAVAASVGLLVMLSLGAWLLWPS